MKRSAFALLPLLSVMACGSPDRLEVEDAWARDTVGRTANAAVFMTIRSAASDRLIGASAPIAKKGDLMTFEGATAAMGMRHVDAIEIPAHAHVSLDPRGLHVWLSDLNGPLRQGQAFPLTLLFEKAGERRVEVTVIAPSAVPPDSKT